MSRPETQLQKSVLRYIRERGFQAVAVPNGSVLAGDRQRRGIQTNSLKAQGMMVGFPDLIVFAPGGRVGFIEVKTEGGRLSEAQANVRFWMTRDGHKHSVCRSIDDVTDTLKTWGWIDG